jgi:methyl-accepting chemotaxis protein
MKSREHKGNAREGFSAENSMKWFTNLSTRAKLSLGFGFMALMLIAVLLSAFAGIRAVQKSENTLVDLMTIRNNVNRQRAGMLTTLLTSDRALQEKWLAEISESSRENDALMGELVSRNEGDEFIRTRLEKIRAAQDQLKSTRDREIIPAILEGKKETAMPLLMGIQSERDTNIRAATREMAQRVAQDVRYEVARTNTIFLLMAVVTLLTGLLLVLLLNRLIADPLRNITVIAEKIAVGDLTAAIAVENRRDEVGVLTHTFSKMTQSLRNMAGVATKIAEGDLRVQISPSSESDALGNAFAAMVKNLQGTIGDVTEAVNVLSSSASDIVASTNQLASSAAESAAAVMETTTTIEEVRQTAKLSTDKVRRVSESAQRAAQSSEAGKKSTEQTSVGMNRIKEQMGSIAEGMMRLSEQSQEIGEIIATVDDLAQQSNLLAVNAAIEAAEAGEHGKGFAVVAQEVRNLSEQSRQATTQVRTILSDIQKATSVAVLATEQGNKAVEAGVVQSRVAGEAIVALSDSVGEAAQASTQIAASNQQQLIGIDQVVIAMENVKEASNQNVAGAKQLETAARNLSALGLKLKRTLERYHS